MNEQATPQGTLGSAEIERLKKTHGRIYEVVVDDEGNEDEMMKGDALIRANFGTDPGALTETEWARLCAEALWIETWRLRNQAEMIARLFGSVRV